MNTVNASKTKIKQLGFSEPEIEPMSRHLYLQHFNHSNELFNSLRQFVDATIISSIHFQATRDTLPETRHTREYQPFTS
ncbi:MULTISPECIES: hypothetical protein [unclassified Burkholderia]|uniref:hypothetical protein n=1 Tax=unclassified Burkholderia TaxID=2613784 RepID=UPI00141E0F34|nr:MULTISPECIES: hypothetical protein [unclassified Burkholderia]NIE55263.1 hypothetical protein [Burkholderia sp. Ap-955]NIF08170.1 hypothetical protein [Burkholderia sp. Ax-1735]NIG01193.1 hypothetical protein [Burkholderia sp. Tr-849]